MISAIVVHLDHDFGKNLILACNGQYQYWLTPLGLFGQYKGQSYENDSPVQKAHKTEIIKHWVGYVIKEKVMG